jgi:hypothetical protein
MARQRDGPDCFLVYVINQENDVAIPQTRALKPVGETRCSKSQRNGVRVKVGRLWRQCISGSPDESGRSAQALTPGG